MTTATQRVRWLARAEDVPATEGQILLVLAVGNRCAEAGCLTELRWRAHVASAAQGPQTVAALRDLLCALFLHAARSPALRVDIREKIEHLDEALRLHE